MKIRLVKTAADVVDAIGRDRLYAITGKRSQNVTNWIDAGRFPPTTFVVMNAELRRRRFRAPASLWSMIEARAA